MSSHIHFRLFLKFLQYCQKTHIAITESPLPFSLPLITQSQSRHLPNNSYPREKKDHTS